MQNSKQLYKVLAADFKSEKKYYFANRGEGMLQGREKSTDRIFLVNKNTQEAWELISANGRFSFWDASAVEIASVLNIPYRAQRNAIELQAPYHFGINEFKSGVAYVSWTLQPDGRYYADEDGFGMEDDDEINVYAFIDCSANILIPFQPMDDDLRNRYRIQAMNISKNREEIPYVCLSPDMTLPLSENTNLQAHKDKLWKIVYGMMFQFGSPAMNAYKYDEYQGRIGIFTAINPNPEHYLSLTILGNLVEGTDDTYEIVIVTSLFKEGEEPQGCCTKMGVFNSVEIEEIMSVEDNAELILNNFLESADMIYSGNLPKL